MMKRYCLLGLLLLSRFAAAQAQVLLSETFNTSLPPSWTIVNGGSNAVTWQRTTNGLSGQTLNGTQFMICNSDAAGNIPPVYLHEELVSPTVNAAGQPLVFLEFDHYFRHNGLNDSAHVDVWDGAAWHRIVSYASTLGGFSAPAHQQYNITAYANANLKVRFIYDDANTWAWYWALDNVQILAPSPYDVGVTAFIHPIYNGRRYTTAALSAAEPVQVTIRNFGSAAASNIPIYLQVDGAPAVGPTLLAGPLNPSQTQNQLLAFAANLAATGAHHLRAWTAFPNDANHANDTLDLALQQFANDPPAFPHCISFESLPDTAYQSTAIGLGNIEDADFSTSVVGAGRMRTYAGPGFAYAGNRALTLDRNPSGTPDAINLVTFTWNLSQFHVPGDVLTADLWLMEHGDEVQAHDSVWVRGCDTCAWINVLPWNTLTGGNNGLYYNTGTLNLTTLLQSRGQDYSASFQLRVGQEDNFAATSLGGSDGMTFDNVCLRRILPINAGVTALTAPPAQGGCGSSATPVTVTVTNFGTVALSNVPVQAVVTGGVTATLNATVPGPIAPGASVAANLGTINAAAGGAVLIQAYTLVAADSARGDDSLRVSLSLAPALAAPTALGDTACIGGSAWVRVGLANPNLQYIWYDQALGGNAIGTGDSLQVGPMVGPATRYVEARSIGRAHLGPANNQFGSGSDFSSLADGLVFDALADIVIDSVVVYPSDTGVVRLLLLNNAGTRLDSVDVLVSPTAALQPMRIAVGLPVPQGSAYVLRASGSTVPGLYRNNSGAAYPYVLPGAAQIISAANGLSGYYYFFYDWVVRYALCPSPRALATIDTTSALPVAAFAVASSGLSTQFSNGSAHAQYYAWDFGDGQSSTAVSPTHAYAVDGTYTVCLIAQGDCGSDTLCQSVTVTCLPIQSGFVATANQLALQLSDTSSIAVGQAWNFGDGQMGNGNSVQHTYGADGNYVVCLTHWNACGDTAQYCDTVQVCAALNAALGFAANGLSVAFSDQSSGTPTAWFWDFGDGGTSVLAAPNHTFSTAGNQVVTLIVTNLCGEQDTVVQNIMLVGLPMADQAMVRLYPNPTAAQAVLELPGSWVGAYRLRVHNGTGRVMQAREVQLAGGHIMQAISIRLDGLAEGAYWVELEGEGKHIALGLQKLH